MRMDYVIKTRNNRNRNTNFSTLSPIKSDWKDEESLINDMYYFNHI